MHACELGVGRPRGSCTKEAIGSLSHVKAHQYSGSGAMFQREQMEFFQSSGFLLPHVG